MVAPVVFTIAQIAARAAPVVAAFARGGLVRVRQALVKRAASRARTKAAQEAAGRAKTSIPKLEKRLAELNKRESILAKRVQTATQKGGKVLPISPGTGKITQFTVRAEQVLRGARAKQQAQEATEQAARRLVGRQTAIRQDAKRFSDAVRLQEQARVKAELSRRARSLRKLITRERLELLKGGK